MDAFGDGLEHLDVDGRGRAVVPVILEFEFVVAGGDALGTFEGREGEGRLGGDARDDRADVEGEDGRVHVHLVRIEDRRVLERGEDGIGQPRREGIFVRAVYFYFIFFVVRQTRDRPCEGTMALALCISALSLRSEGE